VFLGRDVHPIRSPKMFPPGVHATGRKKIDAEIVHKDGVALCAYGDSGWGKTVREGKYGSEGFSRELIAPSVAAIELTGFRPGWVTWVPSNTHMDLVPQFAKRLAEALGVEAVEAVHKTKSNAQQKTMQNSSTQCRNVWECFEVRGARETSCLLIDDIVDSGWTLCAIAVKLRQAGSGEVMPFALATARRRSDN
jgi:ATP-dependent DNA helicase RecQ